MSSTAYVLGHAPDELRRLDEQSAILRPATAALLGGCGLREGMCVLDVGCGTGEVSLMCAEAVGPSGAVTGVDRAPEALEKARDRAALRGVGHASFEEADILELTATEPYDAVVGRMVLMHQADAAAVLAHLAGLARPGAVMAFAEIFIVPGRTTVPARPLFETVIGWIDLTLARTGVDTRMGMGLSDAFRRAGLPAPEVRVEPLLLVGDDAAYIRWAVETLRTVLPLVEPLGVATPAAVDIATLADRLDDEGRAAGGAAMPCMLGTAWARLPG
jgi:SAM-dependent methyltransferase